MTTTQEKPKTIIEHAQAQLPEGKLVDIIARVGGTIPLEWPRYDAKGNPTEEGLSRCDYNQQGKRINTKLVRNIELGNLKLQRLNLADRDDAAFYERLMDWYENSNDPRIERKGIEIVEGGTRYPMPFPNYDGASFKQLETGLPMMLGDDQEANRKLLESCALFELQQEKPRQKVLDLLEMLGTTVGFESADDAVEEIA